MVEARRAATVIVARDRDAGLEVVLMRRSARAAFMPDLYVFPGGRIDPADARGGAADRVAAIRETFEEVGVLVGTTGVEPGRLAMARAELAAGTLAFDALGERLGIVLDLATVVPFSRWITPLTEPRRFDTSFFVARCPPGQEPRADEREVHDARFVRPTDALHDPALALSFPTRKHLERIAPFSTVAELLEFAVEKPIHPVMPDASDRDVFTLPAALEGRW